MEGVILTPLKVIEHPKGNILHALRKSSPTFENFGEAYFSCIKFNELKGWKKHTKMQLNVIVPHGEIEFIVFDDRKNSATFNNFYKIRLSINNYQRLTICPGLWLAFKGIGTEENLLLNIASIEHDPIESENKDFNEIQLP